MWEIRTNLKQYKTDSMINLNLFPEFILWYGLYRFSNRAYVRRITNINASNSLEHCTHMFIIITNITTINLLVGSWN